MPKDKDFGITAKEACENTRKLGQEFERINTMKEADARTKDLAMAADGTTQRKCKSTIMAGSWTDEEEKAEPQDESEIMCYYYTGQEPHHCPGPMGDERHYVIKNGSLVMAHSRCHKRDQDGEKKTPNVIIR